MEEMKMNEILVKDEKVNKEVVIELEKKACEKANAAKRFQAYVEKTKKK